jgi:dTDP-4-amino-4,6-dideoxygalactose transaminase
MTVVPFVDLAAQHSATEPGVSSAIGRVVSNCSYILGPDVEAFETAFAEFTGVNYAVGVGSGLDALRLALTAIDIGPGDEVIVPANTYIATALAVSALGARPVFVDCNPATYNIDTDLIEAAITSRTRAVIPVHLTGQAADMDKVLMIAARHGLKTVEDAAQAHGTIYKGRRCGSIGAAGCFSFYPSKNLGGCGDGGIVTTDDENLAARLRCLRNYGQRAKHDHIEKGLNTRLDTLQAAVLNVKLPHLTEWNALRAKHAEAYRGLLDGVGDITFQTCAPYSTHIYHLFIIETAERDALAEHLGSQGIETGVHYPKPIHLQKAYADLGYKKGDFPHAEKCAERMLSLPMYPQLREEQICYIAEQIAMFYEATIAGRQPSTVGRREQSTP